MTKTTTTKSEPRTVYRITAEMAQLLKTVIEMNDNQGLEFSEGEVLRQEGKIDSGLRVRPWPPIGGFQGDGPESFILLAKPLKLGDIDD